MRNESKPFLGNNLFVNTTMIVHAHEKWFYIEILEVVNISLKNIDC